MYLCLHQYSKIVLPYNSQNYPLSYLTGVKPKELIVYLLVYLGTMVNCSNQFLSNVTPSSPAILHQTCKNL
jgi:hypothetical protein